MSRNWKEIPKRDPAFEAGNEKTREIDTMDMGYAGYKKRKTEYI